MVVEGDDPEASDSARSGRSLCIVRVSEDYSVRDTLRR